MQCIITEKQSNQINIHGETKKRSRDSQIVKAEGKKSKAEPQWASIKHQTNNKSFRSM